MAIRRNTSTKPQLRKSHGPKRFLFNEWSKVGRMDLAKAGLLSKYTNFESFQFACAARGKKNVTRDDFEDFVILKTKAAKDAWLANLKGAK